MAQGALQTRDSLQALRVSEGSVATFGEKNVWDFISAALLAHNQITSELLNLYCGITTNRETRGGKPQQVSAVKITRELGIAHGGKVGPGPLIGLPIETFGNALVWTRESLRWLSTKQIAAQYDALVAADLRQIQANLKTAIYYPINRTWIDSEVDGATLPVKALANADGVTPPLGPNGEDFGTSHNHYLAAATWTDVAMRALVTTVVEHVSDGTATIYINSSDYTNMSGLTGFSPLLLPNLVAGVNATHAIEVLNVVSTNNRLIGYYDGIAVWTKPWALASYPTCHMDSPQEGKPLSVRILGTGDEGIGPVNSVIAGNAGITQISGSGDLELVYEYDEYPIRCKQWRRTYGIAPTNRVAMAVLYIGGGSYVTPTFTY